MEECRFIVDTTFRSAFGLSGNDLLLYSLVYSFSQGDQGCYYGSLDFTAYVLGCSRSTVKRTFANLVERGLIEKHMIELNGKARVAYGSKCTPGFKMNLEDGFKMNPNNKRINKEIERVNNAREGFVIPTVQEVADYCEERGNEVDAEEFVDFYTSKGWKVGNQKMKDWKACIRTWERNKEKRVPREKRNKATTPQEVMEHNQRAAERLNDPKFWEEFFNGNK